MRCYLIRHCLGILVPLLLTGCALVLEYPLTMTSMSVWGVTGKTPTDHAVSNLAGQDCKLDRVVDDEQVCKDFEPKNIEVIDKSHRNHEKVLIAK